MEPINRDALLDAITVDLPGHEEADDDMFFLAYGGLKFLITGEDGIMLTDADLECHAAVGADRLSDLLYMDLNEGWQGIAPGEEERRARRICDHLAAAYCGFFQIAKGSAAEEAA